MDNYKELIERLEKCAEWAEFHARIINKNVGDLFRQAADAITALTEENAKLRAELADKKDAKEE